jgi:hypothetical protein
LQYSAVKAFRPQCHQNGGVTLPEAFKTDPGPVAGIN